MSHTRKKPRPGQQRSSHVTGHDDEAEQRHALEELLRQLAHQVVRRVQERHHRADHRPRDPV